MRTLLVLCLLVCLGLPVQAHTLHLLVADPPNTSIDVALRQLQREVAERSHGRLRLAIHNNSVWRGKARSELELLNLIHSGEADAGLISTAPLANFDPVFELLDVPFLFDTYPQVDAVVDGATGRRLLATLPPHGFHGLAFWDSGFRVLASRHPFTGAGNLGGQRVRVMESHSYQVFIRLMGGVPVPVGHGKVHDMVQSGYLDAVDMAYASHLEHRIYEYARYILDTRHIDEEKVMLVNEALFHRLSPQERGWLADATWDLRLHERELFRDEERTAIAQLKTRGVTFTAVSAAQRASLKEACRPLYDALLRQWTEPWQQALLAGHPE